VTRRPYPTVGARFVTTDIPARGLAGAVLLLLLTGAPARAGCGEVPADVSPGVLEDVGGRQVRRVVGDGVVDVADALVLLRASVGFDELAWPIEETDCPFAPGDGAPGEIDPTSEPATFRSEGDGSLDVADVVLVALQGAVGALRLAPRLPQPTDSRDVAILDLSPRNGESDTKLAALRHALDVAGLPVAVVTEDLAVAVGHRLVACSSRIYPSTLDDGERVLLRQHVRRGGVLVAPRVTDRSLFALFGLLDEESSREHHVLTWSVEGGDASLRWLDDPLEQTISLGSERYAEVFATKSLAPDSAEVLARFEDGSAAVLKNAHGDGHAYLLGFSFSDLVARNLLGVDYDAERTYSNGFEPTADTVMLFLRGLYATHVPFATWKHTSPRGSRATLLITHDVDSTSGMQTMGDFAELEAARGISATYFVTTHRVADDLGPDYYTPHLTEIGRVRDVGHALASHSVGHFPDFDDPDRFPEGAVGTVPADYRPAHDGTQTNGGTVFGELDVSRQLLESDFGVEITSFRSGHLPFHEKQVNVLEALGYLNDSSRSANDLLTNFPHRTRRDGTFSGSLTDVLEIPMTLSDVFRDDPISEDNVAQKAAAWLDVIERNAANGAPTTLLIHPNRDFKLAAETLLLDSLPPDLLVGPSLEEFGDYWRRRERLEFETELVGGTLRVTLRGADAADDPDLSFVVETGPGEIEIEVRNEAGARLPFVTRPWGESRLLLHRDPSDN